MNPAFKKFNRQQPQRVGQNQNLSNAGLVGNAMKGNGLKIGAISSKAQSRKVTNNGGKYESLRYESNNQKLLNQSYDEGYASNSIGGLGQGNDNDYTQSSGGMQIL